MKLQFSHMGFFVRDLEKQVAFYTAKLGFTQTDRGTLELPNGVAELAFLSQDPDEHHQLVLVTGRPAEQHFNLINQISLRAESIEALQSLHRDLKGTADDLVAVTHGNAISLYLRDPEGNRIELYVDTPWYVSQPCRVELPIELAADELLAWVERHASTLPGFKPRAQWRAEMARRMGIEA